MQTYDLSKFSNCANPGFLASSVANGHPVLQYHAHKKWIETNLSGFAEFNEALKAGELFRIPTWWYCKEYAEAIKPKEESKKKEATIHDPPFPVDSWFYKKSEEYFRLKALKEKEATMRKPPFPGAILTDLVDDETNHPIYISTNGAQAVPEGWLATAVAPLYDEAAWVDPKLIKPKLIVACQEAVATKSIPIWEAITGGYVAVTEDGDGLDLSNPYILIYKDRGGARVMVATSSDSVKDQPFTDIADASRPYINPQGLIEVYEKKEEK